MSVERSFSSSNSLRAAKSAASSRDHSRRGGAAERRKEAMEARLNVQAYFFMKPTWVATPFLASALELRTHAHSIIGVFGDSQCIALEEHSRFIFVPPLLMGGCEVHTLRVGLERALPPQSTQRDRVSGVRRRSRTRSCKTDARMLVASTLAGKISLKPRSARQEKLQLACGAVREVRDHLRRSQKSHR